MMMMIMIIIIALSFSFFELFNLIFPQPSSDMKWCVSWTVNTIVDLHRLHIKPSRLTVGFVIFKKQLTNLLDQLLREK